MGTTAATVDRDTLAETIGNLDDVTLVEMMFILLGEMQGMPGWGTAPTARMARRILFTEIAERWLPPDVFGDAFRRLGFDDEGEDA